MQSTKQNLLRSLINVSGMTFISRILGFIRDMLFARIFGASVAMDAFLIAFKLPNLLRRIFAEGAFSQAFVPTLSEFKHKKSIDETREFIASISGLLFLILCILVILGMIFTSGVLLITAPGFANTPQKLILASTLLRITLPYIIFISLSSMAGSILNTWHNFIIPAFTPTILNISCIIFAIFFRSYFDQPIAALAVAVFVGGILQLCFQLPYLYKINMLVLPKINLHNLAVWRVIKLMIPAIFAMSISQISLVINTIFASFLPNGSISWMNFADRLMELPTGVLGVALGTILLPSLSKYASLKDHINFSKTLDWGLKLCLLISLPATIGLAICAKAITMTLFMYGKFQYFDAIMTSRALIAYTIGLIGLIFIKILTPAFYANYDIKTPVKIAIFVLVITQIMNLCFISKLHHVGLALSISLGALINAACLCYILIKRKIYVPNVKWGSVISRLILATIIMAIALMLSLHYLPFDFIGHTYIRILSLFILIIIAIITYTISLFILKFHLKDFSMQ